MKLAALTHNFLNAAARYAVTLNFTRSTATAFYKNYNDALDFISELPAGTLVKQPVKVNNFYRVYVTL